MTNDVVVATRRSKRLQERSADACASPGTPGHRDATAPPMKRRKISREATPFNRPKNEIRERQLSKIEEMPMEMLAEISSHLEPADMLRFGRTNKYFDSIFLSNTSGIIWRATRSNVVPPLPNCPDDLNEPQYAELLFEESCHYCERNNIELAMYISWDARRRICDHCLQTKCSLKHPTSLKLKDLRELCTFLPKIEAPTSEFDDTLRDYFFRDIAKKWRESYNCSEDKQEWKLSKIKELEAIREHARLCECWSAARHDLERAEVENRQNEIAEHIIQLGWGDEVDKMQRNDLKFQDLPAMRRLCRKDLTESILESLNPKIDEFMSDVKRTRILLERNEFLSTRLPILQLVHDTHLLSIPLRDRYWYPTASELFREPEIRNIVNDASLTLQSMQEKLQFAIPRVLPDVIKQVCERIDDQLMTHFVDGNPEDETERDKAVLNLASTVFECVNCPVLDRLMRKCFLRYSEVLVHACTRRYKCPEHIEDHEFIDVYLPGDGYRSHECNLSLSETAAKVVPFLVELCGLDPSTTTTQMMDDLDPIFECTACGNLEQGRATMTWLRTVAHMDENPDHLESVELLNEEDSEVARNRISEEHERASALVHSDNKLMQCAYCKFPPRREYSTLVNNKQILRHVRKVHGVAWPTFKKDLIRDLNGGHIPPVFFMWPPRGL